ncbi:hypothetical protein EST38_g12316 [Candolleomyces aberdarensis]|uniref:Uncharacterized protein n=1 Tax=Candolleomyces aberdarensis TaxID=2316362 RepID=A0A4Q2D2N9_9AGAR|nr:hypothetical protein EST38_g12316 [Candolleomyces aberdarensis]
MQVPWLAPRTAHALRDELATGRLWLPEIPPAKRPIDLNIDILICLWEYTKDQITRDIGAVAALSKYLGLHPAWVPEDCEITYGRLYQLYSLPAPVGGQYMENIITTAVYCSHPIDLHHPKPPENFIFRNARGGAVDLAV